MSPGDTPESEPRWAPWLGPLIALLGAAGTLVVSRLTGLSFAEERRLHILEHAMALPRAVHDTGFGATVSGAGRGIYEELSSYGVWPGLVSAWVAEWCRTHGALDLLTGTRSGWLFITALSPVALYSIVRVSQSRRVAALASVILFATPRWTHGAALGSDAVVVGSLWIILAALYLRSRPAPHAASGRTDRRFRLSGALFAIVLGASIAVSLASLWILPALLLYSALGSGPFARRTLGRARLTVPFGFLFSLLVAPVTALVMNPTLWRGGAVTIAGWFLAPLTPQIELGLYKPSPVNGSVPAWYAADFLFATTPVLTIVAAFVGSVLLARATYLRRRTGERGAPGLGALAAVVVPAVLFGNLVTPNVLLRFPPRAEVALPFVAALAAVGVDAVATRLVGDARRPFVLALAAVSFLGFGLFDIATAGASFGLLAGETRGAVKGQKWVVGDGSELGALTAYLDGLGRPSLTLKSGEAPRTYFAALKGLGRMRTAVEVGARGDYVLVRGQRADAVAEARYFGAGVWSVTPVSKLLFSGLPPE